MANKQDKQNEEETNDWNQSDDDDNWDDWGDGDDDDGKFVHVEKQPEENSAQATKETAKVVVVDDVAKGEAAVPPNTSASSTSNSSASSGWGLWGGKLSSVLSTATEGLGNITTHVNQGLNQIIGVPDPEELARINAAEAAAKPTASTTPDEEEDETREGKQENASAGAAFNLGMVTTLGSKVLNTGLDTLEGIGKKTMTILQDNDPKLMNKRKLLGLDASSGPNLSAVLLEAKKDADQMEETMQQLQLEKQKAQLRFDVLFENYCGLVHYEALEILSKESRLKLDTLLDAVSGQALSDLQETIGEVRELLELEDLECDSEGDYTPAELNERLSATIADAELGIKFDDVASHWSKSLSWLGSEEATAADLEQVYARSVNALSEACALEMCKLHKIAELMLVKPHHSTANEVDGIVHLCKQFNGHIQGLTQRHAALLSSMSSAQDADQREECKARVITYFAEMLTAVKFIEQAYKLFTPILQMGAV